MALVGNQEQEAPALPEQPGEPGVPIRLMRSVESGSPPRPRERQQRFRWPDAIDVIFEKDPAALNVFEALMYQGLHAVLLHRMSHALYRAHIPILPRLVSQIARLLTGGIEIHPGAKIGKRFFIDHGSGVVIGETAEIGNNVMLYHQVTLGATGWWKTLGPNRRVKRHPTIEDNVTIGCGASILGPVTIGRNSKIGAMALVLEDVPPGSVVVAKPAELLMLRGKLLPQHQELTQGWEPEYQI
jgi:serine O-acetyltransferase